MKPVFQEEGMTSTLSHFRNLATVLVDIPGAMDEVQMVAFEPSLEEQSDDVDEFEKQEWNNAETDTENDNDEMLYQSNDNDEDNDKDIDDDEDGDQDDE